MIIQVELSDVVLQDSVRQAVANAYLGTNYDSGQGRAAVKEQVVRWARSQDYSTVILEMAPEIIREVVASELTAVIKVEVKRQIKVLRETGQLAMSES